MNWRFWKKKGKLTMLDVFPNIEGIQKSMDEFGEKYNEAIMKEKKAKKFMENKKHKIKIPEGYEIKNETSSINSEGITISVDLKPIKKELPKTWREYCNITGHELQTVYITTPNGNYHKEMEALYMLLRLRDYYNDGWKPDWKYNDKKYVIESISNIIMVTNFSNSNQVLNFKTAKIRDEFLKNFAEIIETAKPLL